MPALYLYVKKDPSFPAITQEYLHKFIYFPDVCIFRLRIYFSKFLIEKFEFPIQVNLSS